MNKMSNTVIGFLNILTLISSIVIIGSALWMGRSKTTCEHFLQKPLLVLGLAIMVLSLAGLIGACCDVSWVLWVYLFFMVFIIVALMGLTLFGFIVINHGGGVWLLLFKQYYYINLPLITIIYTLLDFVLS